MDPHWLSLTVLRYILDEEGRVGVSKLSKVPLSVGKQVKLSAVHIRPFSVIFELWLGCKTYSSTDCYTRNTEHWNIWRVSLKPTGSQLCFPNLFSILFSGTLVNSADSHTLVFSLYIPANASLLSCIFTSFVFFYYKKLTYLYFHMNSEFSACLDPR